MSLKLVRRRGGLSKGRVGVRGDVAIRRPVRLYQLLGREGVLERQHVRPSANAQ